MENGFDPSIDLFITYIIITTTSSTSQTVDSIRQDKVETKTNPMEEMRCGGQKKVIVCLREKEIQVILFKQKVIY